MDLFLQRNFKIFYKMEGYGMNIFKIFIIVAYGFLVTSDTFSMEDEDFYEQFNDFFEIDLENNDSKETYNQNVINKNDNLIENQQVVLTLNQKQLSKNNQKKRKYSINIGNTCNICGESDKTEYSPEKLLEHLKTHCNKTTLHQNDQGKYLCPFPRCSFETANLNALKIHIHVHSNWKENSCSFCSESFKTKPQLYHHIKLKHPNEPKQKNNKKKKRKKEYKYEINNGDTCNICGDLNKTAFSKKELLKHLKTHCNKKTLYQNDEDKYQCPFPKCSRKTTHFDSLKRHMHVHSNYEEYSCSVCCETFKTTQYLSQHMKSVHSNELKQKKYQINNGDTCNICGDSNKTHYSSEPQLLKHLKSHCKDLNKNDQGKYLCPFPSCTHTTKQLSYLKRHLEVHSNYKRHSCSICSEAFRAPQSLTRHIKLKHPNEPKQSTQKKNKNIVDSDERLIITHQPKNIQLPKKADTPNKNTEKQTKQIPSQKIDEDNDNEIEIFENDNSESHNEEQDWKNIIIQAEKEYKNNEHKKAYKSIIKAYQLFSETDEEDAHLEFLESFYGDDCIQEFKNFDKVFKTFIKDCVYKKICIDSIEELFEEYQENTEQITESQLFGKISRYFKQITEKSRHELFRNIFNTYKNKDYDFVNFFEQFIQPKSLTQIVKEKWTKWLTGMKHNSESFSQISEIKKLHKDWVKGNRSIYQISSLNQHNPQEVDLSNASVACGYCSIFNLIFMKNNEFDDEKIFETEYFTQHQKLSNPETFKLWALKALKDLSKHKAEELKNKIEEITQNDQEYQELCQRLCKSYGTLSFPETINQFSEKDYETIGSEMATSMLYLSDLKVLAGENGRDFIYYEAENSAQYIKASSSFEQFIKNFTQDLAEHVIAFRNNGKPVYCVVQPGKAHWICVMITKNGMFIADSQNNDLRDLDHITRLYDLFFATDMSSVNVIF